MCAITKVRPLFTADISKSIHMVFGNLLPGETGVIICLLTYFILLIPGYYRQVGITFILFCRTSCCSSVTESLHLSSGVFTAGPLGPWPPF